VPAAGQAEIVARDLQPLVVLRRLEHPPEQCAIVALQLRTFSQGSSGVLDPFGKGIPNGLQLTEIECPGLPREGRHGRDHRRPTEPLGCEPRQLGFEPSDLPPQLSTSTALVATRPQRMPTISLQ
jgi:hypothetical protein